MTGAPVDGWATYLASLVGSWRALLAPHAGAEVVEEVGFVAAVCPPYPVFSNALLLDPEALPDLAARFSGPYAVWTADPRTAYVVPHAGYRPTEVTIPMVLPLEALAATSSDVPVEPIDPDRVTEANGQPSVLLRDVPGLRTYGTPDGASVAALIVVGSDVNASFVATRLQARRQGLASAVLGAALTAARADGFTTSSLQATAMGTGVYARLGYRPVGRWQEWVRP